MTTPTPRRKTHVWWRWPAIIAIAYLVISLGIFTAEYQSEMSKIDRGNYTDTFAPVIFSQLITLPMSALHHTWSGYPVQFDADAYRHAVRASLAPTLTNIAVETVGLLLIGLIIARLVRRGRSTD